MQIRGFLQLIDAIGDQIRGGGGRRRSEGRNGRKAGAVGLGTEDKEKEEKEEMQRRFGHGFEVKSEGPARDKKWVSEKKNGGFSLKEGSVGLGHRDLVLE